MFIYNAKVQKQNKKKYRTTKLHKLRTRNSEFFFILNYYEQHLILHLIEHRSNKFIPMFLKLWRTNKKLIVKLITIEIVNVNKLRQKQLVPLALFM